MKRSMALTFFLLLATYPCVSQEQPVLCNDGSGGFKAEFRTGVSVHVGASRNGELAARKCEADLSWDNHRLQVATDASQIDIDAFGVDLGLGAPVAAFQVKKLEGDCCMEYRVYSLSKPPQLLSTIKGGASFSAADADLDGQVEIWTDDAAAMDGLEGLSLAEFDSAPNVVLRFSRSKLLDVSAAFPASFDERIAKLRTELNPDDLRDFKDSGSTQSSGGPRSAEQLHRLRVVKAAVLEIVLAYLYSGREQQAWRSLTEMWPAQDVSRVRESILQARDRAIRVQTDGIAASVPGRRKKATIFDATSKTPEAKPDVIAPEPILLSRSGTDFPQPESAVILVIDSAGKVRLVDAMGKSAVDPALIQAAKGWKFIPAFKDGRAVASRSRMAVSSRQ